MLTLWRNKLRASDRPQRIFEAVREVIDATNVLRRRTRQPERSRGRVHDVPIAVTETFEVFFREEFPKMVALGLGLTGERETARDLAQEAMLRGNQRWDRVGQFDRPACWVRRVLINLATDHHRRRATERANASRVATVDRLVMDDPGDEQWWEAVRALPDRQRAAVALHYLEDRSIADVAEILAIAEGTVKSTLAKARRKLEQQLMHEEGRR